MPRLACQYGTSGNNSISGPIDNTISGTSGGSGHLETRAWRGWWSSMTSRGSILSFVISTPLQQYRGEVGMKDQPNPNQEVWSQVWVEMFVWSFNSLLSPGLPQSHKSFISVLFQCFKHEQRRSDFMIAFNRLNNVNTILSDSVYKNILFLFFMSNFCFKKALQMTVCIFCQNIFILNFLST